MLPCKAEHIKYGIGDCGCPEAEAVIWPFQVWVHLEPTGVADFHFDNGDISFERDMPAKNISHAINVVGCQIIEGWIKNNFKGELT